VRVVSTVLVRDEADVIDDQILYHLDAGVDFVIATDHQSQDGTTEILERYVREGCLLRIPAMGPVFESGWRTRMARLAATQYGADWVINTDADQFWWPRCGALKDVLEAVPDRFGVVGAMIRHFVPRPDDGRSFYERMTVRISPPAAIHDPTSPWRPGSTVAHRASPDVIVLHAGYSILGADLRRVPGWYPFEILHFPYRSGAQWLEKTSRRAHGDKSLGIYLKGYAARESGRGDEVYGSIDVDDSTLADGLLRGVLTEDTRLRDRLRALRGIGPAPLALRRLSAGSEAGEGREARDRAALDFPTDAAALYEATLVRLQRRIDDVDLRARALV